jgi:hypothetical protein
MTTVKIDIPFANVGTKTPIDDTRADGVVNFQQGYTDDYSRELGVDPLAKPVERDKLNYLFNIITTNQIDWIQSAFPQWIQSNAYAVNSFVRYSTNVGTTPEAIYRCVNATVAGSNAPLNNPDWEELLTMAQLKASIPMPENNLISVATDFNTLGTKNATYEVASDAVASSSPNSPSPRAGMLEAKVWGVGPASFAVERYLDYNGQVYFRGKSGSSAWSSWQTITGLPYTPANQNITIIGNNGLTGGGDLSQNRTIGLAPIPTLTLLGNGTGASTWATAITLANGIQFNNTTTLGLGNITPLSVATTSGGVSAKNGLFTGAAGAFLGSDNATPGNIALRPNGVGSATGQFVVGTDGSANSSFELRANGAVRGTAFTVPIGVSNGIEIYYGIVNSNGGANARNEYINNYGSKSGGHEFYTRSDTGAGINRVGGFYGVGQVGNPNRLTITDPSGVTANVRSDGVFYSSREIYLTSGANGQSVVMRPNGPDNANGQAILDSNGSLTLTGTLASGGNVLSTNQYLVLAPTGASPGNGSIIFRPQNVGSTSGQAYIDPSGNFIGSGIIRPGSDERVKENMRNIEGALEIVRRVFPGKLYERTDRNGETESGYGAQFVKSHPETAHLVSVDGEFPDEASAYSEIKNFHHLHYDGVIPYATSAIIELHDIVLEQRYLIAELRAELNELKGV